MSDFLPTDLRDTPIQAPPLPGKIVAREDPEAVFDALSADLLLHAHNCVHTFGSFHLALSGGSTPMPLYQQLMYDPRYRGLPWKQTHLWMVDERRVPFDHELSNFRQIKEIIVDHTDMPATNVHPMQTSLADPAADYEKTYREILSSRPKGQDRLDYVLLGMGDNGHTASLFPHTQVLEQRTRFVDYCDGPTVTPPPRITLTYLAINAARFVAVLVLGEKKAPMLQRVATGTETYQDLPIKGVHPLSGEFAWYVDRAACETKSA
ncbi:MAG: 6-phosphogluconolactonase [Planctomycetes bacterium]|nr:6-phosphogluconolactonase [Planctomycetota bacterium]